MYITKGCLKMKITFLGTADGLPRKGRHCSCTMIEVGDTIYFVDMGAPLADIIVNRDNIDYERIKAVFITHPHGDHYDGLRMFVALEKWHYPDSATQCYLPDQILADAIEPCLAESPESSNTKVKTHVYKKGKFYDDGVLSVEAIPNDHLNHIKRNSYAFKIEAEGRKILFTGDLTADMHDFPQIAFEERFDLIVTECAHAQPETLGGKLSEVKTTMAVINHIYPPEKEKYLGALDGKFGYRILIGKDNDAVEL